MKLIFCTHYVTNVNPKFKIEIESGLLKYFLYKILVNSKFTKN